MAYLTSSEFAPLNVHNDPPIFYDPEWSGHSYTVNYQSVPANPYGQRFIKPGQVFVLDVTTQKLLAAYDTTDLSTYQSFLVSGWHDVTHGDDNVEVVVEGKIVASYCFGVLGAGTYVPSAYGTVPAAIKTQHPNLIFRP